jgi:hypothetical protein
VFERRDYFLVEPDLSHVPPLVQPAVAILRIGIDEEGIVREQCVTRGVRADIDGLILDAVHQWWFTPARLWKAIVPPDGNLPAGAAVPVGLTVTVTVGERAHLP